MNIEENSNEVIWHQKFLVFRLKYQKCSKESIFLHIILKELINLIIFLQRKITHIMFIKKQFVLLWITS